MFLNKTAYRNKQTIIGDDSQQVVSEYFIMETSNSIRSVHRSPYSFKSVTAGTHTEGH